MNTVFVIQRPDGTPFQRDDAMGILATDSEGQAIRFAYAREEQRAEVMRYVPERLPPERQNVDEMAREFLAREYDDIPAIAKRIREGTSRDGGIPRALRALTAALIEAKQQGPGEAREWKELPENADERRIFDETVAMFNGDVALAVAQTLASMHRCAQYPKGSYALQLAIMANAVARLPTAPQVEAKRQTGEGESPSLKRIIPAAHPYPKPDQVTGEDTGSIGEHAYADGWNDCRKAMVAAAAKPSGE